MPDPGLDSVAESVVRELSRTGATVATAESLTGGLVAAVLTSVPGASVAVRGGVVAYATDLKTSLAGVPADLLDRSGPVSAATASAMASGARRVCDATYGVATTGVAGPNWQDGHPPGTLYVAVAGPRGEVTDAPAGLRGDRTAVRNAAVRCALDLLRRVVAGAAESTPRSQR